MRIVLGAPGCISKENSEGDWNLCSFNFQVIFIGNLLQKLLGSR